MLRIAFLFSLLIAPLIAQTADPEAPSAHERLLLQRIEQLESRIAALEAAASKPKAESVTSAPQPTETAVATPETLPAAAQTSAPSDSPLAFKDGTTLNFELDGYYSINGNNPANRTNLLRTNDASSRSFSLGQTGIIVERTPDASLNRRLGFRLDLLFGQNTDYLQGSPANELRPAIYRNIYQAYGSYLLPVGQGLQVDFGKFANTFGMEGNYNKDQLNYSRSYLFSLLPFYHQGFRFTYPLTSHLTAQYWLVNGLSQTEDFNGFRSQAALLTWKPKSAVTLSANYYVGRESRQLPEPLMPITSASTTAFPAGRTHVIDTYASVNLNPKWTAAVEGDYLVTRVLPESRPDRVWGAAAYLHRELTSQISLNGRFTYLDDRNGYFSGASNLLKDFTVTAVYQPVNGFQAKLEYRHDWTNRNFFTTINPAILVPYQNTATLGLIWWLGGKTQSW